MNFLMRRISPRIVVEVSPDAFTFTTEKTSFRLNTYLYVVVKDGKALASAIGEDNGSGSLPDGYRVDLFKCARPLPEPINKLKQLEMFLYYGTLKARNEFGLLKMAIRPTLVFRHIETLDLALCGYQRGLFEQLAMAVGASRVVFE